MHFRECCRSASLGLLAAHWCTAQNTTGGKWFQEPFGMLQTNLRRIDVDMDVNQVANDIVDHGAVAWLITVGGILANYPTDLEFQKRNDLLSQRQSGDLIQDALDAARAKDMRLLGRMDFSKVQLDVAKEHPDWLYISPNGTWQNHTNNLVSACPSGPYYQERIFDILGEVISRYKLDGFFVNQANMNERDYWRVYHGVCHCQNCHTRWSNYTDDKLPNGPEDDNYNEWKRWSNGLIDEWTGRVRAFISERLPNAGLIMGTAADIRFHEANNAVGREFWAQHTSETVSSYASYRPEVPILVNAAIFLDQVYRFASEEPHRIAQYYVQAISRGANPSTYIMAQPGKIPWAGYKQAGDIMRFHRDHKDVYTGLKPVAKTGLVLPQESAMDEDAYAEAESEFRGLYKMLQELHVPFDVIGQEYISAMDANGGLQRYEVIVLPNLGGLGPNSTQHLDTWVASGGTLIATGAVGVGDDEQIELQSLPASARTNVTTEEDELWSRYFAPSQNRTEEGYYTGPIIPIIGAYFEYEWKERADGVYKLLGFAPFAPPEYTYGNTQVNVRGAGIGPYEAGTGVLFPFTVGRGYRETGLGQFRDFFQLILQEHAATEKLHFSLAEQVEVTLNVKEGSTVVHLINMSGERHQNMGSHLRIPGGSITAQGDIRARALVANTELEVSGGQIQLPELDLFEVVVIEGL